MPDETNIPGEKQAVVNSPSFKFFRRIGPGVVTGASDDDPSGLTTYAQSGAQYGLTVLWTALWTMPLMISVQEMSARIAMASGQGVTKALLRKFPRWFVCGIVAMLVIANTINIGADIAGMAEAMTLITPIPFAVAAILLTVGIVALEVYLPYKKYVVLLKLLCLSLLSYIAAACVIKIDWAAVAYHGIVPTVNLTDPNFWYLLVAVLGTTISPYLIFWQGHQELEERRAATRFVTRKQAIRSMRQDTWLGMGISNLIMFFVMLVTASVLFGKITEINSMADAAAALQPLAGGYAAWFFAFGVIGTGLLAIPILAGSAAYAMAEIFNLPEGLALTWSQARGFYSIILASTLVGLALNFSGINAIDFLIWSAIINGIAMPILLIAVLFVANDKTIVGSLTNKWHSNLFGWLTVIIFLSAIIGLVVTQV